MYNKSQLNHYVFINAIPLNEKFFQRFFPSFLKTSCKPLWLDKWNRIISSFVVFKRLLKLISTQISCDYNFKPFPENKQKIKELITDLLCKLHQGTFRAF